MINYFSLKFFTTLDWIESALAIFHTYIKQDALSLINKLDGGVFFTNMICIIQLLLLISLIVSSTLAIGKAIYIFANVTFLDMEAEEVGVQKVAASAYVFQIQTTQKLFQNSLCISF